MEKTQSYVVESVAVEGENGEFTRIELEATCNAPNENDMVNITILTDATDATEFRVGRVVCVSYKFD